jgi:hypothetical protein
MRTNALLTLAFVAATGAALAGCGEEPVPANVTYTHDIKPLLAAHCIRCHSVGADGKLNMDPGISSSFSLGKQVADGDFSRPDDVGMVHGLTYYTAPNPGVAKMGAFLVSMPPPPAPPLTSREHDMLTKWIANPLP